MATRAAGAGSGSGPAITARVARSGGAIVAALLLAKLFSTLKESFVAQAFGVGREVDAYVLASALSLWVATIVGNGIDGVAIPLLKQAQANSEEQWRAYAGQVFCIVCAFGAAAGAVLWWLAPPLGRWLGDSGAFGAQLVASIRVFALVPLLNAVARWSAALLQQRGHFFWANAADCAAPLVAVLVIVAWPWRGGLLLAWAQLAGIAAVALLMLLFGVRELGAWPRWSTQRDGLLALSARRYAPAVLGTTIGAAKPLLVRALAGGLGTGAIAVLGYADRVVAVLLALIGAAVIRSVTTHAADAITAGRWSEIDHLLRRTSLLAFAAGAAGALAICALASPLVSVLLQRGAFTAADAAAVTHTLRWLVPHLPFFCYASILIGIGYAMGLQRLLVISAVVGLAVCAMAGLLLRQPLGTAGIAMAASLAFVASAACTHLLVRAEVKRRHPQPV